MRRGPAACERSPFGAALFDALRLVLHAVKAGAVEDDRRVQRAAQAEEVKHREERAPGHVQHSADVHAVHQENTVGLRRHLLARARAGRCRGLGNRLTGHPLVGAEQALHELRLPAAHLQAGGAAPLLEQWHRQLREVLTTRAHGDVPWARGAHDRGGAQQAHSEVVCSKAAPAGEPQGALLAGGVTRGW